MYPAVHVEVGSKKTKTPENILPIMGWGELIDEEKVGFLRSPGFGLFRIIQDQQ